jgi:hypothetical protein
MSRSGNANSSAGSYGFGEIKVLNASKGSSNAKSTKPKPSRMQHQQPSSSASSSNKKNETYENVDEANKLLHKLAATVTPLMLRRKWFVPTLKEFFPENPNLLGLNVNHGQSILVRLRPHARKQSFYDWEHVLGTLIHELTHILVGPHNSEFYRIMDELDEEVLDIEEFLFMCQRVFYTRYKRILRQAKYLPPYLSARKLPFSLDKVSVLSLQILCCLPV